MVKLKLCKGLSYSGIVKATIDEPFINVDDTIVDAVIQTGYFSVVKEPEEVISLGNIEKEGKQTEEKPISKMNKTELEAKAKELDIDISGCQKVGDIRSLLEDVTIDEKIEAAFEFEE